MTDSTSAVRVAGLPALRRDLQRIAGDLDDLERANAAALRVVVPAANARAPRRTGRLAGSIRGNKSPGRATVSAGGPGVTYAGVVHYGWPARNLAEQPFLVDAAHDTESTWVPLYVADVEHALDRVAGRTY